jgi:hypothetical protein
MAAAFLQPACATNPMPNECTVTGPLSALPGMSEAAICERFMQALTDARGNDALPEGVAIALTLHPRGTIEARIAAGRDGKSETYPVVAVDALDRALRPDDLVRLAGAAAQALNQSTTDQHPRSDAHQRGK